jgi:hypothetical protein
VNAVTERTNAQIFLDAHPDLRAARERSRVWQRIKAAASIRPAGEELFIVGGDTLGGEDELFLDRLARGARPSGEPLSRELFLELSPALQAQVWRDLLLEEPPSTKTQSGID